jgi:hypothetical protein
MHFSLQGSRLSSFLAYRFFCSTGLCSHDFIVRVWETLFQSLQQKDARKYVKLLARPTENLVC